MKEIFFITGTDTDAGKTYIACQLLLAAQNSGLKTLGLKPLAAGAEKTSSGWRNDDALLLQQASTVQLAYEDINPFCFAEAIAPHIAAEKNHVALSAAGIAEKIQAVLDITDADVVVIEGAGGWRVPLNDTETLADAVKILQIPVILVVRMKLGCINHASLTAEAINADGVTLHGWIANDLGNPMPFLADNIVALEKRLPAQRIVMDQSTYPLSS
jgi:dethiobiotin synthetase